VNVMTATSADWTGCFFDQSYYLRCYKTATASHDCDCDDGYVRDGTGECEPCPEGKFFNSDQKSCKNCPFGQYNNIVPSFNCSRAQPGFWVPDGMGAIAQSVCPDGFLCPETGTRIYNDVPESCPDNSYCTANELTLCPAGSQFLSEVHVMTKTYVTHQLTDSVATSPSIPSDLQSNMFSTSFYYSGMNIDYLPVYMSTFLKIESHVNQNGRYLEVLSNFLCFYLHFKVTVLGDLGDHTLQKNIPDINIQNCYIRVIHKKNTFTLIFVKNETISGISDDDDNGWLLGNDGYYKGNFYEIFI